MNKIFKSIWNEQTGTYVAVSENTRSKGKKSSSTLCTALAVALGTFSLSAQAWEWHISDGTNQNSISTFLTGQTATFSGDGNNISTELSNRKLTVKLKDDLELTSVKTGDSTLNSSGLSITGGPSVTAAGIAAGGKAITGVAMIGTPLGTDAVNVDYLNTQIDANKTRYYSVKSTVTGAGSNYDNDGATGTNAMAAGVNASAAGLSSIAVGHGAQARGEYVVAIGKNAGFGALSNGNNIIGTDAGMNITDIRSVSNNIMGNQAGVGLTSNDGKNLSFPGFGPGSNTLIGNKAGFTMSGDGNVAIGNLAGAVGTNQKKATGDNNVYMGHLAGAGSSSDRTIIIGAQAGDSTSNDRSIFIGNYANGGVDAPTRNAIALGSTSRALDKEAIAIGFNTRAQASNAMALGRGAIAGELGIDESNDIAMGTAALATGEESVAIGNISEATGYRSMSLGSETSATGSEATALGSAAQAFANSATAVGFGARADEYGAIATGVSSHAAGKYSVAQGHGAVTGSNLGFPLTNPLGSDVNPSTPGDYAVAIGYQAQGLGENTIAIGKRAGEGALGFNNVMIGDQAGHNSQTPNNIFIGQRAGQDFGADPDGNEGAPFLRGHNVSMGMDTLQGGYGENNTGIGLRAGRWQEGSSNTHLGSFAGVAQHGDFNVNAGYFAGQYTDSRGSVNIGVEAGAGVPGDRIQADKAVSIGYQAKAIVDESVAIGNKSGASGYRSVSLGSGTSATGDSATALGSASQALAGSTTAVGLGARADQYGATAVGVNSRARGRYSAAFGQTAVANNAYDVALGSGSETDTAVATENITINGKTYDFAGITPLSTVSVGKVGSERTITNVAAGQISDTSTDAINGSQLFQTNQAIGDLTQSIVNAIGGVEISNGGITKPSYTIGEQTFNTISEAINFMADGWYLGTSNKPANPIPGGGEGGSTTTPPAESTSPEAPIQVRPGDTLTLVGGDNINITQDTEAKEVTIATDPNLVVNSVTAGQTVMDNSGVSVGDNIHLGETGLIISGGPSVTTGGINAGNLLITNVAAGSIGAESTDAINGSQIHAINTSVANAFGGGSTVQEDGTVRAPSYTVGSKDTVVNNVGDAIDILNQGWTLTAGGNDSQVQSGDVVSLSNNDGNIVITHAADSGAVAFDLNENVTVNNVNATTVNASTVRAGNTVINNSGVSFVNEAGEPVGPSMRPDGIDAGGYPIANVAPGVRPTDAANMGQLSQAVNTINHRIDRVESRADAGTAAAMAVAGLGQPYRPGQSMVSLGSGLWRGETGYALGISTLSGNGKWLIKGAATSSSRGGVGGSASINYAW